MSMSSKKIFVDQGLELSKLLTLKRAGMLDESSILRHLDSDAARKVGRALADGEIKTLNDSEQDLYQMVNNL